MKQFLIVFGILMTLVFSAQTSFADKPCSISNPCNESCPVATPIPVPCPCETVTPCAPSCCNKCCEDWLCRLETYYCRIGLSECQKDQARRAVAQFLCDTKCLNLGCCESKCECKQYKRELQNLNCEMKKIITKCQYHDYKCVRDEVKSQVKCCHKCIIWPFRFCPFSCKIGCNFIK